MDSATADLASLAPAHRQAIEETLDLTDINEVVRRFTPLVRATAYRAVRNPTLRRDLEQEGYLALIIAAARFDGSRGVPFEWYAKKMVSFAVRKAMQSELHHNPFLYSDDRAYEADGAEHSAETGPADTVAAHSISDMAGSGGEELDFTTSVGMFVDALPEQLRHIAKRVFWENATQADIARELGVSRRTIVSRIHAVRELGRIGLSANWEAMKAA